MFLGHFAVGFAAKRLSPKTSLGTTIAAASFLDLLWPIFVMTGIEWFRIVPGDTKLNPLAFDHYPWSHGVATSLLWGVLFGLVVFRWGSGRRGAWVTGLAVFSHWVLDWLTHKPDLPVAPGIGPKLGLGLWNHPAVEIPLEIGMYVVAVWLYAAGTRARDRIGTWALWPLVAVLAALHVANLTSPPPPSTQVVAYADVVAVVFLAWAVWADRHRVPAPASAASRRATALP
jgi:hypothetical protein